MSFSALVVMVLPQSALGARDLIVGRPVPVYQKPARGSKTLTILPSGKRVPVSSRRYGRWYKVLILSDGKKRIGFVRRSDLKGSSFHKRLKKKVKDPHRYRDGVGVGFDWVVSINSQGAREFDDGEGSPKQIGEMSGTATFLGVFADIPVSNYISLRVSLLSRKNAFTGDFGISGQDSQTVELVQNFFSFGGTVKVYPFLNWPFWAGVTAHFANATNVNLVYANQGEVPVSSEDLPFFVFLQGALGADFHIWDNFFLIPDGRVGQVVNTSPAITSIEGHLSFAYRF